MIQSIPEIDKNIKNLYDSITNLNKQILQSLYNQFTFIIFFATNFKIIF